MQVQQMRSVNKKRLFMNRVNVRLTSPGNCLMLMTALKQEGMTYEIVHNMLRNGTGPRYPQRFCGRDPGDRAERWQHREWRGAVFKQRNLYDKIRQPRDYQA